jgi:hypothetical protein
VKRKTTGAPTARTHFEQVPLEAVKALAREDAEAIAPSAPAKDAATVEPAGNRRDSAAAGHFHAVQFYQSPDDLCRIVGRFVGEGLEQGGSAMLIVTPDHAERIEACLRARAIDVTALKQANTLLVFDARSTLDLFMTDGMPNPGAFRRTVGGLLSQLHGTKEHTSIRAYGEMVDLLWKDGREAAAIRLETFWNQLASRHDFDLLCGYSMGNFYKGAAFDEIKAQHTHVVPSDGGAAVPTHARSTDVHA